MTIFALLLWMSAACLCSPVYPNNMRNKRETTDCQPPANLSGIFESLNQNINASMYLQLSNYSTQSNDFNTHFVFDSQSQESKSCPSSVSDGPDDPVRSRSICPWWYNVTQLPSGHYPSVIPQAVCKCSDCVGATANECIRVSTNIRVLREIGCQDGFRKYQPVVKIHHVGCTCAKKRVSQNDDCGGWGCLR